MQNPGTSLRTDVPGTAADAPDRITDSHREASPHRSPPYEANTVALEEQLKGTSITRKGDPCPQFTPPHLKWWLQEDNVLQGQPLHPLNMLCKSLQMH